MDNFLENYCEQNNLDYPVVKRGFDLYFKTELHNVIYAAVGAAVAAAMDAQPASRKGASGGNSKSGKNEFYAPHKETLICDLHYLGFVNQEQTLVNFAFVCPGRSYGDFRHEVTYTTADCLAMFFTKEVDELERVEFIRRADLPKNILNEAEILQSVSNVTNYRYKVTVKRTVADVREYCEILEIIPHDFIGANHHEPGSGTRSDF